MNLYEHVGQRIAEFRKTYNSGEGLSQQALAAKIGSTANTISRWETATYKPSLDDLEVLSRFFGRSILDFFPNAPQTENPEITALLRAASSLPNEDLIELRNYAEFRIARTIYEGPRPTRGRKRKEIDP